VQLKQTLLAARFQVILQPEINPVFAGAEYLRKAFMLCQQPQDVIILQHLQMIIGGAGTHAFKLIPSFAK